VYSSRYLPSTASSRSEFAYRTHRVIYNFLRLVPSSLTPSPTDEVLDIAAVESPVLFTPLSRPKPVGSGCKKKDERGGGDANGSGSPESDSSHGGIDRQDMFDELRARVAERDRQKEVDAHESDQRASQTRKMLRECMEKVNERDRCIANPGGDRGSSLAPAVTIIKKNNTMKFLVEPVSPSTAVEQRNVASSAPTMMSLGEGQSSGSPFGNPLCSSTPSLTPQNVLPPVRGETNDAAEDHMSGSGSDSSSAYIDIDMVDDIESLVNAGIMPLVSKSLKDEISLCWQNLERSRSSKFNSLADE